jgi:hypothetical protein
MPEDGIARALSGLTSELMLLAFGFSVGTTALHSDIHILVPQNPNRGRICWSLISRARSN